MTREQIITETRNLLNEVVARFWTDDELYIYAHLAETELVRVLKDRYCISLMVEVQLSIQKPIDYFPNAGGYSTEDDFLREVRVFTKDTANPDLMTDALHVEFEDLQIHKELPAFTPTQLDCIYWLAKDLAQGVGGKPIIVVSPEATAMFGWWLIYLRIPDAWTNLNKADPPSVHADAHHALATKIAQLALEDDGEFTSAAHFEALYKEQVAEINEVAISKIKGQERASKVKGEER